MADFGGNVNINTISEMSVTSCGVINGGHNASKQVREETVANNVIQFQRLSQAVGSIKQTVDDAFHLLQVNANRMDGLENRMDGLDNISCHVLEKLENIENLLQQHAHPANNEAILTPKANASPEVRRNSGQKQQKNRVLSAKKQNDSVSPFGDDNTNIILDISSDDEEGKLGLTNNSAMRVSASPQLRVASRNKRQKSHIAFSDFQPTFSKYHRGSSSKLQERISQASNGGIVGRRLAFTVSPLNMTIKVPKPEPTDAIRSKKTVRQIMTKFMKTKFTVKADMNLTDEQHHLSAYVFHPHFDQCKILFKVDDYSGSRKDFHSLIPGNTIDAKVVHMMSLKSTWNQKHNNHQTFWMLPPSFARDVTRGHTIEDLICDFSTYWMPAFNNLNHIYVPVEDICGQWYLMVASVKDKVLYHLDPYFENQNVHPRQETIEKLWQVITQILQYEIYPTSFTTEVMQGGSWNISEPIGNITDGFCQHTAVWVLEWLRMGADFQPVIKYGDVVRMGVAMDLLIGEHNECKEMLEEKITDFCQNINYA